MVIMMLSVIFQRVKVEKPHVVTKNEMHYNLTDDEDNAQVNEVL